MSGYGWLTESTLLPRESKKISVDSSGVFNMKAIILEQKNKQPTSKVLSSSKTKTNPGIEQRVEKDLTSKSIENQSSDFSATHVEAALKVKQKIYDQLQKKGDAFKDSLVDFTAKATDGDEEYQKIRQQFYGQKLKQVRIDQARTHQSNMVNDIERDRLHWEKEMLGQLIHGVQEARPKVQQSYDKKLTVQEKEALREVLAEQEQERKKLEELKKRRQELGEEKLRKLKKLNIIKEKNSEKKDKTEPHKE